MPHSSANSESQSQGGDATLFDPPLFSPEWYRKRADEVRYSGETVSRYNYFIAIAEAIERTRPEMQANAQPENQNKPSNT